MKDFEHNLASMWNKCSCTVIWTFFGIAFLWDWKTDLFQSCGHCWVFQIFFISSYPFTNNFRRLCIVFYWNNVVLCRQGDMNVNSNCVSFIDLGNFLKCFSLLLIMKKLCTTQNLCKDLKNMIYKYKTFSRMFAIYMYVYIHIYTNNC